MMKLIVEIEETTDGKTAVRLNTKNERTTWLEERVADRLLPALNELLSREGEQIE
jgi:hypothetical protein